MKRIIQFSLPLVFLILGSSLLQSQQLSVQTETGKQILSRADLEALPHVTVTASEHGSPPMNFEGVALKSVLERRA